MLHRKHHIEYSKTDLKFKITQINGSQIIATYIGDDLDFRKQEEDSRGAVIYVIAVVFIWGLSIVMLIASYVRKHRMDKNVSLYLKEIQVVRNRSDREKVLQVVNHLDQQPGVFHVNRSAEEQLSPSSSFVLSPSPPLSAKTSEKMLPNSSSQQRSHYTLKRVQSRPRSNSYSLSSNNVNLNGCSQNYKLQSQRLPKICIEEEVDYMDSNISSTSEYEPDSPGLISLERHSQTFMSAFSTNV